MMLSIMHAHAGDGRYINGNRQVDIQLLWVFVQFCKDYGNYHGTSMHSMQIVASS